MKAYTELTPMQITLLETVLIDAGNCPTSYDTMIGDNFSWFTARDIRRITGWTKEQCAGVISGALEAGLIDEEERNDFSVPVDVWEMLKAAGHPFPS